MRLGGPRLTPEEEREQAAADRLDLVLAAWQRDELDLAGDCADHLAVARLLAADARAAEPAPHEPLVALRAALAARSTARAHRSRWRHVAFTARVAPAVALVAVVLLAILIPMRHDSQQPLAPQLAVTKANRYLTLASRRAVEAKQVPATATTAQVERAASKAAQALADAKAARALLVSVSSDYPGRDAKLAAAEATIADLQKTVDNLQDRLGQTTGQSTGGPSTTVPESGGTTPTTEPPPATTTTSEPETTTTTTEPETTTTTAPETTTTTTDTTVPVTSESVTTTSLPLDLEDAIPPVTTP